MEATGGTALYVCSLLFFFFLTEVSSEYIHIPTLVHHGIEGRSLLLSVETRFSLDEVEIQGTWSHTRPSGTRATLVTFTKESTITDMMYRNHLLFREPNVSLLIRKLNPDDEGDYTLDLNIEFHNKTGLVIKEKRTVHVTVDVPVSSPVIEKNPSYAVIEDKSNVTLSCSVEKGTRVVFQWLRDNVALGPNDRYHFSKENSTLFINPVRKEDKGMYSCVASNPASPGRSSKPVELNVYYGPYNLEVNSGQGLRTGEVFTINPGEQVFFECQADSNPPNSYVWISKSHNATQVITEGPRLKVCLYRLAQAEEYLCRAFNNVTQKQDEAQFTLVVASLGPGKEKHTQDGSSLSPLAAITVSSLFIIGCMLLFFLRRTCHPKRVLMSIYNRPLSEQKRPHRSGHEDATEDFGIYEFVSIPGKMESAQASCRSLARLESVQDMHTTIYDVIRHVPETPTHSLLN
ncbi:HEPACAM family member 2 [Halichoeres trimaculatus]|uniref:HEPACAM family member 2 n=1 Tax=Halichoeres trimaculatus TaxID=147232 RepID=UPI003D9F133D